MIEQDSLGTRSETHLLTLYISQVSFDVELVRLAQLVFYAGLCEDTDVHCEGWAANGECDKNPGFMRGDEDQVRLYYLKDEHWESAATSEHFSLSICRGLARACASHSFATTLYL